MKRRKMKSAGGILLAAVMAVTSIIPSSLAEAKSAPYVAVTKKIEVAKGDSRYIAVNGFYGAKVKKKTFSVKNKKIATVSKKGLVKGKKKGSTKITVKVGYTAKGKTYNKKFVTKVKVTKAAAATKAPSKTPTRAPSATVPAATLRPGSTSAPGVSGSPAAGSSAGPAGGMDASAAPGGNEPGGTGTSAAPGGNEPGGTGTSAAPGGSGADTSAAPGITVPTPTPVPTAKPEPTILPDWSWVTEADTSSQIGTKDYSYTVTHSVAADGTYSVDAEAELPPALMHVGDSVSATAEPDEDTVVGTLESDGFSISIPAGAFDSEKTVTATVLGNGHLQIAVDGDTGYHELAMPATISFSLYSAGSDFWDTYRGVYTVTDGGKTYEYYYLPDEDDLRRKNVVTYEVLHFSEQSPGMLRDEDAYTYAAHAKAIDDYTLGSGMQAEVVDGSVSWLTDRVMESLNVTDSAVTDKVKSVLSRSGKIYTLSRAIVNRADATDEEIESANEALASAIADTVVDVMLEQSDKIPGMNVAVATVGSMPTVYKRLKEGDYQAANEAVLKAISSTNVLYQYGKFCVDVVESMADVWTDANMEEVYKAYSGQPAAGAGRASWSDLEGDWDNLNTLAGGVFNGYYLQQLKAYCKKNGITMSSLSKEEEATARKLIAARLHKQFETRYAKDQEIKKREEENQALLDAFRQAGLLERSRYGYKEDTKAIDRVNELFRTKASIEAMFTSQNLDPETVFGTNLYKPSHRRAYTNSVYANLVKIWLAADNKAEGRNSVQQYIENTYNQMQISQQGISLFMYRDYKLKLRNMCREEVKEGIQWTSSDVDVAKVSEDGTVTAVWPGDAYITAAYHGKEYKCLVNVQDPVSLAPDQVTLGEGDTFTLQLLGLSEADGEPSWRSDQEEAVTVSKDGVLTGQTSESGWTSIYAELEDEYGRKRTFQCTVYTAQTKKIVPDSLTLAVGETSAPLTVVDNSGNKVSVTWESWNPEVAAVSADGKVTAKAAGSAEIQATPADGTSGNYLKCYVTVPEIELDDAGLNKRNLNLTVGGKEQLYLIDGDGNKVMPDTASWSSSNTAVATVSEDGTVQAQSAGAAAVTVTFTYNGITDEQDCTVTVEAAGDDSGSGDDAGNTGRITLSSSDVTLNTEYFSYATIMLIRRRSSIDYDVLMPDEVGDSTYWINSNPDVIEVKGAEYSTGFEMKVFPKGKGTATLSVQYEGKTYSCSFTVI